MNEYVGLTLEEFKALGLDYRVVCEDDTTYFVTMDFRPERYNLILVKNVIWGYSLG